MESFWMVWKEGGQAPTAKHSTQFSAQQEAERLAKSVGGRFYVLQAIGVCFKPEVIWHMADNVNNDIDCPF